MLIHTATTKHACNNSDTCTRNLYHKHAPIHVTKIVRQTAKSTNQNWSTVFESSGTRNLHQIELCSIRCKFLVQVSWACFTPITERQKRRISNRRETRRVNGVVATKEMKKSRLQLETNHHWLFVTDDFVLHIFITHCFCSTSLSYRFLQVMPCSLVNISFNCDLEVFSTTKSTMEHH